MEGSNGVGDKGGPPPPSPLTGCYLLLVIGEPHTDQHKDIILQRIAKGLLSWDVGSSLVDLEKELALVTQQALDGEEARYGERLIQFASENLITEILIHPVVSTLAQCMRNLLSSFTRHRHLIHAGYTFAANGSWALQDGTFSYADFSEAFQELEVQRVIRAYENGISLDLHCSPEGDWTKLPMESFSKYCKVKVNPTDVLASGSAAINSFINYLSPFLTPTSLERLLESSDVVGNIRFSRPTLYVFPGGQGDAALFGINGFNMLLDGGYSRKACFWDFVRHLDRLDAVLMTRLNNSNIGGISSVLRRKRQEAVYPQIGHFFCNIQERKALPSPDGDKDNDPLLINLMDEGQEIVSNLRHLGMNPQVCYRDSEPINLYHKVGHGTLDMYVLSPSKDAKEVREFLQKWSQSDQKLFANSRFSRDFSFPIQNLVSIAALLVWQPANPTDTITRILFPGSSPHKKIFEGLDRLKNLEFIKHAVCTEKSLTPVSITKKTAITEKLALKEKEKIFAEKKTDKLIENNMPAVNGEVKEKAVKKSDSTESERSTRLKKLDDSKIAIENEDKQKPKLKTSKPRSNSQQRRKPQQQKASPTTPKKIMENGDVKKPTKPSPSSTPAKSAKDANNRKVIESKTRQAAAAAKPPTIVEAKAKPERKPISRRPKSMKAPISPVKKLVNEVQKPDSISRKGRLDKEGTTDSSTVSTPSADQDSIMKKDISKLTPEEIQQMKAQELADLKEEQEAIKEIEAVFRKGETHTKDNENMRKIKDISIEEKLEKEEYLIIEKEELLQDSIDEKEPKEDETQKLARDSEESEKQQKLSADENVIDKIPEIQDQVNGIVTEAEDILKCKEKHIETSKLTSPEEKLESTDKKTTDKDVEEEVKDVVESHPDEKVSVNIKSGDTTTAPTLPEDERIPLDEIKEDNGQFVEEKHVKEDTKEKEVPLIQLPPKAFETIGKLPSVVGIRLDKQTHIRDIVKTPDEVADLPVHEEVDYEYTHDLKSEVGKTNEIQDMEKIELGDDTLKYTKEKVKEVEQEKDKDDVIQEDIGNVENVKKPSSVQDELKNLTETVLKNESVLEKDILKESEKDHPTPSEKLEGMPEDHEHVKSQEVITTTQHIEKEKQVTEVKNEKEFSGFEEKLSELMGSSDEQGIEKHDEEKPEHTDKHDRDDKDQELDLAVDMQDKKDETKYEKENAPVTTLYSKHICDQEEIQRDKDGQLVELKSDVKENKMETWPERDREAVVPEAVIQFNIDIPENKEVPDDEPLKDVTTENFKEKKQEVKSYPPDFQDKPTNIEREDVALSINLMLKDEGHHQTSVQEEQKLADGIRESPEISDSGEKGEFKQEKKEIGPILKYDIKVISKKDEQQTGAQEIEGIEVLEEKVDTKEVETEARVRDVIVCEDTSEFFENNKAVKMDKIKVEPHKVDGIQVKDPVSNADGQTDEKMSLQIEEAAKKIGDKIDEIGETGVVNEIPTNKGYIEELIISEKLQKQPEKLSSDTEHMSHVEATDSCLEPLVDRNDMSKEAEGNDNMDNIKDDICEDKLGKEQIKEIQSAQRIGELGDKMNIADGEKFSDMTEKVETEMAKYINEDVNILTQNDDKDDELGLGKVDVIAAHVVQKIKSSEYKELQQEPVKRDDIPEKIIDEDTQKSEHKEKKEQVMDRILSEEVEHHTEGEKISSQIQKREQSPIDDVGALGDKSVDEKDQIVLKEIQEKDLSLGKEIKISQEGCKIQELGPTDEGVEKEILIEAKEHRKEEVLPTPGHAKNEEKHIVNNLIQPKQSYKIDVLVKSGQAEMDTDELEHEHETVNVKENNEDILSPQENKDSSLVEKKVAEEIEVRGEINISKGMEVVTEKSMEISKQMEVAVSETLSEDTEKEYNIGYDNSKSAVEKSEEEGVTTPLDVHGENVASAEDKRISEQLFAAKTDEMTDKIEKTADITDKKLLDNERNEMIIEKKIDVNALNEKKSSGTGEHEIDLKTSVDETQVAEVKHGELETYKVDGRIKPIEQTVEKYSTKGSPEKGVSSECKEIIDYESETKKNIDIKEIKATPEIMERMELGRKSPKEREEDVIKIVASVAEVLKSDAPLEEFEGKLPVSTFSPYSSSYTTELRETHITTVDSPTVESKLIRSEIIPSITEEPHCGSASFIEEERKIAAVHIADEEKLVKAGDKRTNLLKESQELLMATSKMISDIKISKMEEVLDSQECEKLDDEDSGTVHRMLVTASSEDGGEETEICPAGSITFSKSSESSGRSSPDQSQKLSQKSSIVDTFSDSLSTVRQIVDTGICEIKSGAEEETMNIKHVSKESGKSEEMISQIISGKSSPDQDVSIKSLALGKSTPVRSNLEKSKDFDDSKKCQEYSKNEGDVYKTYIEEDVVDMNGGLVEEIEDKIKDCMEAEFNKENHKNISCKTDDPTSQKHDVIVVGTKSETDQKTDKAKHDLKQFQEVEQNDKKADSEQKLTTQYDTAEYVGRDDKLKIDAKEAEKQDDVSARDNDSIIGKVAITAIETIGEGFETIKEETTKAIASLKGIIEADLQDSDSLSNKFDDGIEKISQTHTDKKETCDTKKSDIGSLDSQCHSGFKVISPDKSDSGGGDKKLIPSDAEIDNNKTNDFSKLASKDAEVLSEKRSEDNCEQEICGLVSKSEHNHSKFAESTNILQHSITVEADSIKDKIYDRSQNLDEHLNNTPETIKEKIDETEIFASSKYTKETLDKKSDQIENQIKSSEEKNVEPAQLLKGDMIDNKGVSLKMVTDVDNEQRKSEPVAYAIKEDISSDTKTVGKNDNVGKATFIHFESSEITESIAKDLTNSNEAESVKKESIVEKIVDTVTSTIDYSLGKSILSNGEEIMEGSGSNIENTTESIVDMIEGTLKDVVSLPVDKPGSKVETFPQMESQELEACKQTELSETNFSVVSTKQLTSDNKTHWRQDKSDDTDDKESKKTETALEVVDNKVRDMTKSDTEDETSFKKEKFDEEKKGVDKVEQLSDSKADKVPDVHHEDEKILIGELDMLEESVLDIEKAYEKVSEISKSIQFEKCDKASEKGEKQLEPASDTEETRDTIDNTSKYVVFEEFESKPTKLETDHVVTKAAKDVNESFEVVSDMFKSIVFEKCVKDAEKEKSDKEKEYIEDKTDTLSNGRKSPVIQIKADEKVVGQIVDIVTKEVSTKSIEAELQMKTESMESGKGTDLESEGLERDENETMEKAKKEVDIMSQSIISSDPDLKDLDSKVALPPSETKTLANVGDSKIKTSLVTLDVTESQGKKLSISELDISFTEEMSYKDNDKSVSIKAGASVKESSGIEFHDTLSHEKQIPGAVTPPTVPVSPNVIDNCGEEKRLTTKADTLIRELALRSSTPASDDFELLTSTHSDISCDNASKIALDTEKVESDYEEEDQLSVTSQAAHSRDSSHYEFEDDSKKIDPMSISFYGTLPGDSTVEHTHLYEITKAKYSGKQTEEASEENIQLPTCSDNDKASSDQNKGERDRLGNPLGLPPPALPTYLYEITKAKYSYVMSLSTTTEEDDHISYSFPQMDMMTASFYGDLPSEEDECDVIQNWGKPLGLPSPAPPTDNKGTPKKDRKLFANVTAKNKLNDDKKRAESPSKYNKNKKINPVYVDLTYVPHHGNTYYSYVDFFRRIRARYYVFSGIEPSREVYNALLEAKQTWEEKDLEVTIIPTYDTDILGYWVAENEDLLMKYKIDLSPSASRCTINLQDHETSCSAYRLEF